MDINNPIPAEWNAYVTQTNLGLEVVPAHLYSVKPYTSAITRELIFFDTSRGSRPDLTNMVTAGALPNPESFLIQNMRIYFWSSPQNQAVPGGTLPEVYKSSFNDVVQLSTLGILELKIGNKGYGPWPLWTLPAHNFVKGPMESTVNSSYGQIDGMLYAMEPYLMISPLQQFSARISWPSGPVTTAMGGDIPIEVLFDGKLARGIQ